MGALRRLEEGAVTDAELLDKCKRWHYARVETQEQHEDGVRRRREWAQIRDAWLDEKGELRVSVILDKGRPTIGRGQIIELAYMCPTRRNYGMHKTWSNPSWDPA